MTIDSSMVDSGAVDSGMAHVGRDAPEPIRRLERLALPRLALPHASLPRTAVPRLAPARSASPRTASLRAVLPRSAPLGTALLGTNGAAIGLTGHSLTGHERFREWPCWARTCGAPRCREWPCRALEGGSGRAKAAAPHPDVESPGSLLGLPAPVGSLSLLGSPVERVGPRVEPSENNLAGRAAALLGGLVVAVGCRAARSDMPRRRTAS